MKKTEKNEAHFSFKANYKETMTLIFMILRMCDFMVLFLISVILHGRMWCHISCFSKLSDDNQNNSLNLRDIKIKTA